MKDFDYMVNEDIIRTIASTSNDVIVMDSEGVDNSLSRLASMSEDELVKIKGIGRKKARQIMAAFELGKRLFEEKHQSEDLGTSIDIYNHLRAKMEFRQTECCYIVIMNQHFREIATIKMSEGGITETAVDIRTIMKQVILHNGTILALAHNHPTGGPTPSKKDDELTRHVAKACEIMRIFFMDHVIIGNHAFYSYHDHGKL